VVLLLGSPYDVSSTFYLGLDNINWDINVVVIIVCIMEKYTQKLFDCTTYVTV
jgi:hypothetical protein